jgi:hypothetical protein
MQQRLRSRIVLWLLLGPFLIPWPCLPETGTFKPLEGVVDLAGRPVNPFAKGNKVSANVFLFVAVDCPISNKYAPELKRLVNEFEPKGVLFWFVYTDPDITPESIRKHAQEFGLSGRMIYDRKLVLARKSRAEVTPEAALFSPSGDILYHGRIDDRFPVLGKERLQATDRTLATAITSFLAGRSLPVSEAKAVGCRIPPSP